MLSSYLDILKKFPPDKLYLFDEEAVVKIHKYKMYEETWRNKVILQETWRNKVILRILASDTYVTSGYTILMGEFLNNEKILTPLDIKDLPLYIGRSHQSDLFKQLLKSGKLPKNF